MRWWLGKVLNLMERSERATDRGNVGSFAPPGLHDDEWSELTSAANPDRLSELSLAYSSLSAKTGIVSPAPPVSFAILILRKNGICLMRVRLTR